jgi:hypothetical protein
MQGSEEEDDSYCSLYAGGFYQMPKTTGNFYVTPPGQESSRYASGEYATDEVVFEYSDYSGDEFREVKLTHGSVTSETSGSCMLLDGDRLLSTHWTGQAAIWDLATRSYLRSLGRPCTVTEAQKALKKNGYYGGTIDGVAGPGWRRAVAALAKAVKFDYDKEGELTIEFVCQALGFFGHTGSIRSLDILDGGRRLLSASNDSVMISNLETGEIDKIVHMDAKHSAQYVLVSSEDGRDYGYLVKSNREIQKLTLPELHPVYSVFADIEASWSSSETVALRISADKTRLVVDWDGSKIETFDALDGSSETTFVAGPSGEWVLMTEAGFFAASENGARMLNMVRGLRAYSIDQVFQALYRPDLVEEVVNGDPDGIYANAAAELDLEKVLDSGSAPRIEIDRKKTEYQGDSVRVTVQIANTGGGIGRIEWLVDNVNQGVERGFGDLDDMELTRQFAVTPGTNVIKVVAYNEANLIASTPVELVVDTDGAETDSRGRLHVLAVGIDDYAEKRLRLENATADATSVAAMLKIAGAGVFDDVTVTTLLNDQVTEAGLEATFEKLASEMAPRDTFVFFLAGHGRTIEGRYYFIPQDFRYGDRRGVVDRAIAQEQWQKWFSRLSARKSVLIYDTCESESITALARGTAERSAAIERLRHATGRSVIAAARSSEAAYEGLAGHGLLTYSVLAAMDKGDSDNDGFIELQEIATYVSDAVPALSLTHYGIRQQPRYHVTSNIPIGVRVAALEVTEIIPKEPTHVVVKLIEVAPLDRSDAEAAQTLSPGAQVRVIEAEAGLALIARDGLKLGHVPEDALLALH